MYEENLVVFLLIHLTSSVNPPGGGPPHALGRKPQRHNDRKGKGAKTGGETPQTPLRESSTQLRPYML